MQEKGILIQTRIPFIYYMLSHYDYRCPLFASATFIFLPQIVISFKAFNTRGPLLFKISTWEWISAIVIIPISSAVTPSMFDITPTKLVALNFFFLPPLIYRVIIDLFSCSFLRLFNCGTAISLVSKAGLQD